jgi:Bacterial Ig-like domain (group 3)
VLRTVVFKVDNTSQETVLYSFCSASNCTDGAGPNAGLIQDAAGSLYSTTAGGGANTMPDICGEGCGTVFKLDNTGHETVLYSFCSDGGENCTDGLSPEAGLIEDAAGNLYSTTLGGGASGATNGNDGTVFKLATVFATVTLTSNPNPSFVDESVTLSAVVSGTGATPTGSVTFQAGSTALGTVTLANGKASLPTTFTTAGSLSIVANYSGDQHYGPANSSPLTQVVNQYTTGTALVSNPNPSSYGQAVAFTATVSSAGPTPTGTVTFKNGSKSLGSATLSGGVAQITTSKLKVGTFTITASYGGDAANAGSTSPALTQVVNKATSATTVVSSLNPSKVGKKVKFTATVTSSTTTPTGKVTFKDGSKTLGTGNLAKGKASYSTSTLSAGSHNITAVYAGTADIGGSTSPVLVQTVN